MTAREVPILVRLAPRRGGPPRLIGQQRPAPGHDVIVDLTTLRVPTRHLVDVVDEITAQSANVTLIGGNSRVRAYLRASLCGRNATRVVQVR